MKALFRRIAIISVGSVFLLYPSAQAFQPLHLLKKVVITTDAEGGSARPEIVATSNRVFVLYLGNITAGSERTFSMKSYDRNIDTVIASRVLVPTSLQYGGPTDIRIAADGQYLYAFYETHKTTSPTTATTYLWGAKYTLDDSMQRVAATSTYIASSKPMSELQDGGELLDDPAPLVGSSSVFVVTRLKYALATAGRTIYRVREFGKNDLTKLSEFDLDLSSAAKGRGRVASLLFWNNNIYMALATTVSDLGVNEGNDDGALSDIITVRLQQDWTFDSSKDVRVLTAEPNDRENYVTGFRIEGGYFYLTYKQAVGSPPSGQQIAWIKIFDNDFNLVHQEKVKSTIWGPEGGEIRPSIEVIGDRILSGQSAGVGLGKGNAEVFMYEMQTPTSVEDTLEKSNLPGTTNLFHNYPNPFNAITNFEFRIANFGFVSLKVFDLMGREVTTLVHEELPPGIYNVSWIASSNPSGVYVCRLSAGPFIQQRKVLLIR